LDDSGNIILNDDRFVQFSGTGFAPGSIVKVWLFSDPTELSDVIAAADGTFTGKSQIPEGIPTGEHTIQLNGLTQDGQLRSVSLGVLIQPDPVVAAATPPPAGADIAGLMAILWTLAAGILAGFFFFILWRRRKKKEEEEEYSPISLGDNGEPIFASKGFEASPTQQFPDDSRRKTGSAAPPNRKRFNFKPRNA
jgi:cbb3-type cytochrome oxidase subunit 3